MKAPMDAPRDEELISRWRDWPNSDAGRQSLTELFERHHARVALWCLRLSGDRESAADLAQEVFLKAFESLHTFRGDSKFSTWLYVIARNHCYTQLKNRNTPLEPIDETLDYHLADQTPNAHAQLERAGTAEVFGDLVRQSLTDLEARVITLHYVEELPLAAITRLLKLENQSGAKSYIVSARRKLSRAMERWKARNQRAPS
jgi:RNA polymerase sigma-70 factor (ECF subfamily)